MNIDIQLEWNKGKEWFLGEESIPDLIIHGATIDNWDLLFSWLKNNPYVNSVNCYDPFKHKNVSIFPENIHKMLRNKDFNCHIGIKKSGISLRIHSFVSSSIDCDIYTDEFRSYADYGALLSILEEINSITYTKGFTINPEGSTDFVFNENGIFIKTIAEYANWLSK